MKVEWTGHGNENNGKWQCGCSYTTTERLQRRLLRDNIWEKRKEKHVNESAEKGGQNQQTGKTLGYKAGFNYSSASTSSLPSTIGLLSSRISVIRDCGIPVTIRSVSTTRFDDGFNAVSLPSGERSTTENTSHLPLERQA